MRDEHRDARKAGRPAAGLHGDKVADYPQISLRLPPDVRRTLNAVSALRHQPQWRIMMEALDVYVRSLPPNEQEVVEDFVRRTQLRAPGTGRSATVSSDRAD